MQQSLKKNRQRTAKRWLMAGLLIILALSAILVLLLPFIRSAFPARPLTYEPKVSTVRTLAVREADTIDTISIYPDGVNSYTLHMRGSTLMLENGGTLTAIDAVAQKDILDTLTQISVQNTVAEDAAEVADEWAAMGLEKPVCKAVVHYLDGREEQMEVGALVYGSTEYYFRWSGAPGVYLCHSGVLDTLSTPGKMLIPFEQTAIHASLVEKLRIANADGDCELTFASTSSASLTSPCIYPVMDETAQRLMTVLDGFRLGAYEAPLTDENRALYGFDTPLCTFEITQRLGTVNVIDENGSLTTADVPAQILHFVIGRAEGEFFYTCAYQNDVYLISRFLAETLVQADWHKLISRTPAAMGNNELSHIVFETPDAVVEAKITRTESVLENNQLELDVEGNVVFHTVMTINGRDVPQEMQTEVLERLNAFAVEGEVPAGSILAGEPRWRITLVTETGMIRVLEGFRLDAFSDAVSVNGITQHYVSSEAISVLMAGLT